MQRQQALAMGCQQGLLAKQLLGIIPLYMQGKHVSTFRMLTCLRPSLEAIQLHSAHTIVNYPNFVLGYVMGDHQSRAHRSLVLLWYRHLKAKQAAGDGKYIFHTAVLDPLLYVKDLSFPETLGKLQPVRAENTVLTGWMNCLTWYKIASCKTTIWPRRVAYSTLTAEEAVRCNSA